MASDGAGGCGIAQESTIRPLWHGCPAVRLIHSSDWHLGHQLRGEVSREAEHRQFLAWLTEQCVAERADVLLITGDVFDSATPPASAERMWFQFVAATRRAAPSLDIVAIAGNHDSPARLAAPSAVLRELAVHVVGALPAHPEDTSIVVAGGQAVVAAVPFLRAELDAEEVYARSLAAARAHRGRERALIATGHLYVAGADCDYLSERRISFGGQEAASLRLFPDDVTYAALGHIHRAQRVGRRTVRYAGAPIPLALDEARYKNQIVVADIAGDTVTEVRSIEVPRSVPIVRVPARGAAPLADVLVALGELADAATASGERPYLEVVVALDRPQPRLRDAIEAALTAKHARLVYLHVEYTGDRAALGDAVRMRRLVDLDPREVFHRMWSRDHAEPPTAEVTAAFDRLVHDVTQGERS